MRLKTLLGSACCLVLAGTLATAEEVTQERLENADQEPQNWLMVHRTYDAGRYSPLDQINRDNVDELRLAFMTVFDEPSAGGRYASARNEGTPLVEDGFMYVQAGWSRVYKVDVRDGTFGRIVWKVDPEVDRQWVSDATCCGAENRGIAMWHNDIVALTLDGRVMSINKDTGQVNWEHQQADMARAESFTVAPLVVGDVAIYGPAGGEYGIRGWIEAIDLNTGEPKWRTYTIPAPGEPGSETWTRDRTWETGGGSIWQTGSYDPESGMIYFGTGNPAPQIDAEYRPGDNLYASSLLALDVETGEIEWHYQFTPNDPYDYDEVGEMQIVTLEDGNRIGVRAARNGFVYGFDLANGDLQYAEQYVNELTWTEGIDLETGLPVNYNPEADLQKYVEGTVGVRDTTPGIYCPTLGGGKNWQPASYSPSSGQLYVTSNEGCSAYLPTEAPNPNITGGEYDVVAAQQEWNGRLPAPEGTELPAPSTGSALAIDVATGEVTNKVDLPARGNGMMATAGGLVFMSDRAGWMYAYDDETMELLWTVNVGTSLGGPPMSYSVDGTQYIAVLAGAAPSTAQIQEEPSLQYFTPMDAMFVFSVPQAPAE